MCSYHFHGDQILSRYLPRDAVPFHYTCEDSSDDTGSIKENIPERELTNTGPSDRGSFSEMKIIESFDSDVEKDSKFLRELENLPLSSLGTRRKNYLLEDENRKLKIELKNAKKKINSLKVQINATKKKVKKALLSAQVMFHREIQGTEFSKTLVKMQLKKKTRSPWTKAEKRTSLSLFYKGPKTYKYLRRKGVILPAVTTLKSWIENFICKPGFNKKIFDRLKIKADTMQFWEKTCILIFDEMAIKRCLEYSRKIDFVEGFEDLGEFGRRPVPANQVLVLMIRGIYSKWKIPIAYFASCNGVPHNILKQIILNCIDKLTSSNLEPIGIVCDLSSTNQKVFKNLNIEIEKPYFYCNEKKYFAFFDVPHLLKCVRNNFLKNNFSLNGKYISFSDIRKVHELDKISKTGKSLIKITDRHLSPNSFEKMNVKLAAQLLSNSVFAAIKTSLQTNQLVSGTGENTAYFVKTLNDLFDALNSSHFQNKVPCNRVLSDGNKEVLSAINDGYNLLKDLRKVNFNGKLSRPYSFDGFLVTINAVKQFFKQQKEKGFKYLLTGRLNQDPLENQFSVYRQKGGYNRNPTVKSFRAAFKMNIVDNMMKPPVESNSGHKADDDDNIFCLSSEDDSLELMNTLEDSSSLDTESSSVSSISSSVPSDNISLEKCSIVYFSGYLLKKCLDKYNCNKCRASLETSDELNNEEELLIFYKNYYLDNQRGLKTPGDLLKRFTSKCMKQFKKYIEIYLNKKLMLNLRKKIKTCISKTLPEWFKTNENCCTHRAYIFDLLLRTLVFKYCKELSSNLKTPQRKNVKLSILQNR